MKTKKNPIYQHAPLEIDTNHCKLQGNVTNQL